MSVVFALTRSLEESLLGEVMIDHNPGAHTHLPHTSDTLVHVTIIPLLRASRRSNMSWCKVDRSIARRKEIPKMV